MLVLGLLLFALALESYTFVVALRELGGFSRLRGNLDNTTVLAVLLEDAVALLGIVLTLIVGGVSYWLGPHPLFDAAVAIAVGVLLGVMAMFLAGLNRRLLIDTSDQALDRAAEAWLRERGIDADVRSLILDDEQLDRLRARRRRGRALGRHRRRPEAAPRRRARQRKPEAVYWKFKRALR